MAARTLRKSWGYQKLRPLTGRGSLQTTARLERTVTQLANIARDHQVALRVVERREVFQAEIRRIWEYLRFLTLELNS